MEVRWSHHSQPADRVANGESSLYENWLLRGNGVARSLCSPRLYGWKILSMRIFRHLRSLPFHSLASRSTILSYQTGGNYEVDVVSTRPGALV